jgi:hypothetical protein
MVVLSGFLFNAKFFGVQSEFYCGHGTYRASSVGKNRRLMKQLVESLSKRDCLCNYHVISITTVTTNVTFTYSYIDNRKMVDRLTFINNGNERT